MSDAAMMGIALPEPEKDDDFEVWPENEEAVLLFLRVQTQWRTSMAGVTGLDYASVVATAKLYSIEDLPSVFEDLQVMEITAMNLLNKKEAK
jgi:hypothetical protein|tara:strand:- start:328 stop:603 length:276 start_codon:yes stop_codon:yes gene_type:complete